MPLVLTAAIHEQSAYDRQNSEDDSLVDNFFHGFLAAAAEVFSFGKNAHSAWKVGKLVAAGSTRAAAKRGAKSVAGKFGSSMAQGYMNRDKRCRDHGWRCTCKCCRG